MLFIFFMCNTNSGVDFLNSNLWLNFLQVGDRLFSAFGQDTIDALFWTATEPRDRRREHLGVIPHLFFAVAYVCILKLL